MTRNVRAWWWLGAVGLLATTVAPLAGQDDRVEWIGRLEPGKILEVKGIMGSVRATLASGPTTEVVAQKRGRSRDFDEIEIEVVEESDGVTICVMFVWWERGRDPCDHEDGDWDDRRGRRSMDVQVDFEVRLAAGVELVASTVSGDVDVEDVRSDVTASAVNGDLYVSTTGTAWANTVSGSMEIHMGDLGQDDLSFHTVSGDITLWLPAWLDAEVRFSSLSGDLRSDFDMDVTNRRKRRWIGSRIHGVIGDGGQRITLNTVSGDVRLRRGG